MSKQRIYSIPKLEVVVYCPMYEIKKLVTEKCFGKYTTNEFNANFENMKDFKVYVDETDYAVTSAMRNVTILIKNIAFQNKVNHDAAVERINSVLALIKEVDAVYQPKTNDEVVEGLYIDVLRDVYEKKIEREEEADAIRLKQEAKNTAKAKVKNKWFRLGQEYVLKKTDIYGHIVGEEAYRCVKFIYTVGKNPVNCVVMKKLDGLMDTDVRALSKSDCQIFHIKYEPGLYMFPMSQRFYKREIMSLEEFTASRPKPVQKKIEKVAVLNEKKNAYEVKTVEKKKFDPKDTHDVPPKVIKEGSLKSKRLLADPIEEDEELKALKMQRDVLRKMQLTCHASLFSQLQFQIDDIEMKIDERIYELKDKHSPWRV